MVCNKCSTENNDKGLLCRQCGALMVDVFDPAYKNTPVELGERARDLKSFGELKESNFYIPKEQRVGRNVGIKKSLYEYLTKRATEIASDRNEQEAKEREEKVNQGLILHGEEIITRRGKTNLEFFYNFRKRFKASMYIEAAGYDFMDIEIPDELQNKYEYCGDYILAAGKIEECPIVLTDRALYINDIMMEIGELQEAVCYTSIPVVSSTTEIDKRYSKRYAMVLFGKTSRKYTLMPMSDMTEKFASTISAVMQPFRNDRALCDSNNFAGFCIKCGGIDVKEGILKSRCNICGVVDGGFLYRSRSRKINVDEYVKVINDNLAKYEKSELFQDEEKWLLWAKKTAEHMVDAVDKETEHSGIKRCSEETMFCPFCGNKIKRTAKFCNYCGKQNSYSGIQPMNN